MPGTLATIAPMSLDGAGLRHRVDALQWYHTLELPWGVVTPGWFDTRSIVDSIPFPADLSGLRCLDVGTFDGYWAFLMEKRGAREVVAIDVPDPRAWDWPANSTEQAFHEISGRRPGAGFTLASAVLGSHVERRELSVYDLAPEAVGTFDFVYMGSMLIHLRDPIGALMRLRSVCTGTFLLVDNVDLAMGVFPRPMARLDGKGRPWWWVANRAAVARMIDAAGFAVERPWKHFFMPPGRGMKKPALTPRLLASRAGRHAALLAWAGDPHVAILSRPI